MNDLHAEHWPSLQPCMSMMPCRKAALRTVSSSSTSISMPTGSKRTVCVFPTSARRASRRASALVVGHVRLALLRRHLVQQHVGAVERDPADLVERPHLLGIEVQVRLRDERVAVVADVPEVSHDVPEVLAVVQGLPLALAA